MNETYPDYKTYTKLYARFLKKDCGEIFEDIYLKDKIVLDLCCGSGRLSLEAIKRGAKIVYAMDEINQMINPEVFKCQSILYLNEKVYQFLKYGFWSHGIEITNCYDVVTCQQAINYWFDKEHIELVYNSLKPGGVFIFNTFNTKPSKTPSIRTYVLDDINYCEVSYLVDNMVHHFQSAEGLTPHFTSFKWITSLEFFTILQAYFHRICNYVDGNSTTYHCFK